MHEDVGAYLLGALEEAEREAFERHLAGCAECRDEVERLRPAVEALPRSVEPLQAPPELKASLMQAVEEEARAVARSPRGRRRPLRLPRVTPAVAWASAAFLLAVGIAGGLRPGQLTPRDGTGPLARNGRSPAPP